MLKILQFQLPIWNINQFKPQKGDIKTNTKSTIKKMSLKTGSCKQLSKKLPSYLLQSDMELMEKFELVKYLESRRVHDGSVNKENSKWSFKAAVDAQAQGRNRYVNIMPYDQTRVKLLVSEGHSDYINASHMRIDLRNEFESTKVAKYISTQGPTKDTVEHFWQMVFQQSTKKDVAICMVTPLEERRVSKCFKYWCDVEGEYVLLEGARDGFKYDLKLICSSSTADVGIPGVHYTELRLQAIDRDTKDIIGEKNVHHLYYDQWTDFNRPDDWESIYCLSKFARGVSDESNQMIVHCSAGVGRSGTFITLDFLFNCLSNQYENKKDKDLVEMAVHQLRTQRMTMVQSFEQFVFVYEAFKKFLLSG